MREFKVGDRVRALSPYGGALFRPGRKGTVEFINQVGRYSEYTIRPDGSDLWVTIPDDDEHLIPWDQPEPAKMDHLADALDRLTSVLEKLEKRFT